MNSLNLSIVGATEALDIESLGLEESVSSADVHAELQRILASPQFDASDRNRRFLAYVVEETLAGRGERIKAYNIATIVFGRDESFDPQLDPVVRMEARRLRRSLERFYLVEGAGNSLRIAIPKGSYVPKFQDVVAQEAAKFGSMGLGSEPISPFPAICILVMPFEVEDDGQSYKNHSDAMCRQIAFELSCFPEVEVFMPRADLARDAGQCLSFPGRAPDLSFVLEGNAALSEDALRITVMLVSEASGKVVWGNAFEHNVLDKGVLKAREHVANHVVCALIGALDRSTLKFDHSFAGGRARSRVEGDGVGYT